MYRLFPKPRSFVQRHRKLIALAASVGFCAFFASYSVVGYASITNTRVDAPGTVEVAGADWLSGDGVDIMSNGNSAANEWGWNYVGSTLSGMKWQCVEMVNRLYLARGWTTATWYGNGDQMYANAPSTLVKEANGSITSIKPGDALSLDYSGDSVGHASIVSAVSGNTVTIINQNTTAVYSSATYNSTTKTLSLSGWSGYSVIGVIHKPATGGSGGGSEPVVKPTASTEDAPYAADFNGDQWGDTALLHKRTDGGMDAHILYGNVPGYTFVNSTTVVRSLTGTAGWDWTKIKVAAGRFNGDNYADLALLHQRTDGGIDVHVLNGGSGGGLWSNSATLVRQLPGTAGWDWTKIKVVSADTNGDHWDDLILAHERSDGGTDVHVLYGNVPGYTFSNSTTYVRSLAGTAGWTHAKMKLAAGKFNGDGAADLGVLHERSDGGIDIHLLNGGSSPFTNSSTYLRSLAGTAGWDWDAAKLAADDFNGDQWADITLMHERSDGGMDAHILYGNVSGHTFTNGSTYLRSLAGTAGWDWSKVKLAAGPVNGDDYADVVLFHAVAQDGIDVHVLNGGAGSAVFNNSSTAVRQLLASSGWSWALVKIG